MDIQLIPSLHLSKTYIGFLQAFSMNHEIIEKSIKNQTKQRTRDNGDILRIASPFIPTPQPLAYPIGFNHIITLSKASLWFYAVPSVVLVLCCLTTPAAAARNINSPLPLWVSLLVSALMSTKCLWSSLDLSMLT